MPIDLLRPIAQHLLADDVSRLWYTGDKKLQLRLQLPGLFEHIELDCSRDRACWPSGIKYLIHLKEFDTTTTSSSVLEHIRGVNLSALPRGLVKLRLCSALAILTPFTQPLGKRSGVCYDLKSSIPFLQELQIDTYPRTQKPVEADALLPCLPPSLTILRLSPGWELHLKHLDLLPAGLVELGCGIYTKTRLGAKIEDKPLPQLVHLRVAMRRRVNTLVQWPVNIQSRLWHLAPPTLTRLELVEPTLVCPWMVERLPRTVTHLELILLLATVPTINNPVLTFGEIFQALPPNLTVLKLAADEYVESAPVAADFLRFLPESLKVFQLGQWHKRGSAMPIEHSGEASLRTAFSRLPKQLEEMELELNAALTNPILTALPRTLRIFRDSNRLVNRRMRITQAGFTSCLPPNIEVLPLIRLVLKDDIASMPSTISELTIGRFSSYISSTEYIQRASSIQSVVSALERTESDASIARPSLDVTEGFSPPSNRNPMLDAHRSMFASGARIGDGRVSVDSIAFAPASSSSSALQQSSLSSLPVIRTLFGTIFSGLLNLDGSSGRIENRFACTAAKLRSAMKNWPLRSLSVESPVTPLLMPLLPDTITSLTVSFDDPSTIERWPNQLTALSVGEPSVGAAWCHTLPAALTRLDFKVGLVTYELLQCLPQRLTALCITSTEQILERNFFLFGDRSRSSFVQLPPGLLKLEFKAPLCNLSCRTLTFLPRSLTSLALPANWDLELFTTANFDLHSFLPHLVQLSIAERNTSPICCGIAAHILEQEKRLDRIQESAISTYHFRKRLKSCIIM